MGSLGSPISGLNTLEEGKKDQSADPAQSGTTTKQRIKERSNRLRFKKLFIGADHAFGHGS